MTPKRLLQAIAMSLLLLFAVQASFAQDRTITGRVTDSKDGSPVSGATVTAKGTKVATSTAADGTYRITVPASVSTLTITGVGFTTQEVAAKDGAAVAFVAGSTNLNEVVVTGYGTTRKKDLTGAVASVKAKDFNKGVFVAPDQLIQGKIAGVQVLNNSGQPGGAATVRIRGNASIVAGNQPLYVVDGVPLDGGSARPGFGSNAGTSPDANPLNFLNPNDIASIDVLKDASAAAIYGTRAANGVILITTKRGSAGAPRVDVNASVGVSNIMKKLNVLDGNGYRAALKQYGLTTGDYGANTNAMDAILRQALTQDYNVAVSGGNEFGRYRFGAGYLDQEGIIKGSEIKKYTGNFSGAYRFLDSKRLGVDFSLIVAHTTENIAPVTYNAGFQNSVIGQALQWNPTAPLYKNGHLDTIPAFGNTSINPLLMINATTDRADVSEILGSISPSFKITKDLEYRMLYSVRRSVGTRHSMIANWINYQGIQGRGTASIANNENSTQQILHTLTYTKQLTSAFNLNAVAGYEYMRFDYRGNGMSGQDFPNLGVDYFNIMQYASASSRSIYSYASPIQELQSYFARATLNWADRLVVTATIRRDGSSKFGENNKYGTFPSFAAAWNITNEEFLKGSHFFNNLKLRAGWGETGNQNYPGGASQVRFNFIAPNDIRRSNVANPNLKWEASAMTNIGLDFSILGDRVFGTFDWFKKNTKDVIFNTDVVAPGPTDTKVWVNLPGQITNQGFEAAVNVAIIRSQNMNWNVGVNAAFLKNNATGFGNSVYETGALDGQGISGTRSQRLANNQPLNVFYLREFMGIDKATGQSVYKDGGNTLYYVGNPNPKTVYGFTTDFNWHKFSAVVNMNGASGHVIYNNTANTVLPIGNLGTRNIAANLVGTGIKEDQSNPIVASTRFLEKGNYLKMANASVSYSFGALGKAFKNVSVSLTGTNLFVITKFTGFDPEVNTNKQVNGIPSFGIEYQPYPTARTFLLGVHFTL
jgi:TonB-dependent starch-binding outer membrane protein SusC